MGDADAAPADILPEEVRSAARRGEPDRYIAALLAPPAARDDLIALAAFSSELLRVRESVSNRMIGQIKLQWWQDTLQTLAKGGRSGHPVADALGAAMRRHSLPVACLGAPIEAHIADLEDETLVDDAALDGYLKQSDGALTRLALTILGLAPTPQSTEAADWAGVAFGLVRVLARLPLAVRRRFRLGIPASRLVAAGLGSVAAEDLRAHAATAAVLADLRRRARAALNEARDAANGLELCALPGFLHLVMVEPYLRAQEQQGFDPFDHLVEVAPLKRVWRIWRAKRRGCI
jgi:phytoene synthase